MAAVKQGAGVPQAAGTRAARDALWQMGGFFSLTLSSYLMVMLLARGLGPAAYGIYGVIYATLLAIELTTRLGIPQATAKLAAGSADRARSIEATGITLAALVSLLAVAAMWVAAPLLARLLNVPDGARLFRIASIDLPFFALYGVLVHVLNSRRQFRASGIVAMVYGLGKVVGTVVMLMSGLTSIGAALVVNALASLAGVLALLPQVGLVALKPALAERGPIMRLAVSTALADLGIQTLLALDLWALNALGGGLAPEVRGEYVAALNLARVPNLLAFVLTSMLVPMISHALSAGGPAAARPMVLGATRFMLVLLLPACALIAADAASNMSGGFSIRGLALNGRMSGPEGQPARLSAANVVGLFRGRTGDFTLAVEADNPRLAIEMAQERTLEVTLQRLTADAHIADSWNVTGSFDAGTLSDPTLPGSVSTIEGQWTAEPLDGKPIIRVSAGEALLTANRPATEADRPLFNPLRIVEANAVLQNGEISASGAILLDDRSRQLAHFNARHDIDQGAGIASVSADRIEFGPQLQPYEITEQARGLVEGVRGAISANADITWTREDLLGTAIVNIDGVSLSTATIPIVNDVRGEVRFDNLWELTTPPGQEVTIGELNPGIAVRNGRVAFQLLTEQRVAIERAEVDFASGRLAMTPTTITLGADETRFELTLSDVDAADLLRTLNVPDLTATGQLEGRFPLLLTRRSAFVDGGVVRAQGDGGVLSYTGQAGANATGVSRIAFDALRSFRYEQLSLTLDGDLNGDVVSSIEFSGHNSGRPVDLGPIAPVPGLGSVTVRGVPFEFNVRVTAPFRRLAQTAATITDPGSLINQSREEDPQEPVDPDTPPPR